MDIVLQLPFFSLFDFYFCLTCTPFKSRCHPWKLYLKEQTIWRRKKKTYVWGRDFIAQNWHSRGLLYSWGFVWGAIIMVMVWWSPVNYDLFSQGIWQIRIDSRNTCNKGRMGNHVVCVNNKWLFKNILSKIMNMKGMKWWHCSMSRAETKRFWKWYLFLNDNAEIFNFSNGLWVLSASMPSGNSSFHKLWLIIFFLF